MPSTDINGSPILILSLKEVEIVSIALEISKCCMVSNSIIFGVLEEKVQRFLKEVKPGA